MALEPKYAFTLAEAAGVFLGNVISPNADGDVILSYDLYYIHAKDNAGEPTLSARWSDKPADYKSGMIFGWDPASTGPLVVARILAESRGLDCQRGKYADKVISTGAGLTTKPRKPEINTQYVIRLIRQLNAYDTESARVMAKLAKELPPEVVVLHRRPDDAEDALYWHYQIHQGGGGLFRGVIAKPEPKARAIIMIAPSPGEETLETLQAAYPVGASAGSTANPADPVPDTKNPPPHDSDFGA